MSEGGAKLGLENFNFPKSGWESIFRNKGGYGELRNKGGKNEIFL